MIRVVIDTNITVSGLLFGGLPLKIIRAALARRFEWVTSPALIDELERVLRSEKFALSDHEIQALTTPILGMAEIIVPEKTINAILAETSFAKDWNSKEDEVWNEFLKKK